MPRFSLRPYLLGILSCSYLALLFVSTGHAQINNVGDDTSTPIEGVGHDYIKMLAETVSPANGSVSLRIQAPTAKARGITLPFSFAYDSNGVMHLDPGFGASPESNASVFSQGGWSYALPLMQASSWSSTTPGGVTCASVLRSKRSFTGCPRFCLQPR